MIVYSTSRRALLFDNCMVPHRLQYVPFVQVELISISVGLSARFAFVSIQRLEARLFIRCSFRYPPISPSEPCLTFGAIRPQYPSRINHSLLSSLLSSILWSLSSLFSLSHSLLSRKRSNSLLISSLSNGTRFVSSGLGQKPGTEKRLSRFVP